MYNFPVRPEKRKKKPSSSLDDVHSAPYAEYAAKILADEVAEQGSSTLTDALKHTEEGMIIAPEGFTEQEAKLQLKQFVGQFSRDQIRFAALHDRWQVNNFSVDYDEEKLSYVILYDFLPIELLNLSALDLTEVYIPPAMSSLVNLDIAANNFTTLPKLPQTLTTLQCDYNNLTFLPELPEALVRLECQNNQITTLPKLPLNLLKLNCSDNQLTILPVLPHKLEVLYCSDNQLTTLPDIPASVVIGRFVENRLDLQTKLQLKSRGFPA